MCGYTERVMEYSLGWGRWQNIHMMRLHQDNQTPTIDPPKSFHTCREGKKRQMSKKRQMVRSFFGTPGSIVYKHIRRKNWIPEQFLLSTYAPEGGRVWEAGTPSVAPLTENKEVLASPCMSTSEIIAHKVSEPSNRQLTLRALFGLELKITRTQYK